MANITMSLRRTRAEDEHRCGVCGAAFAPIEDSGSRIFSVRLPGQETLTAIMCGGCHSKWTGGTTVTLAVMASPAAPA
jgi:hypothetical protein